MSLLTLELTARFLLDILRAVPQASVSHAHCTMPTATQLYYAVVMSIGGRGMSTGSILCSSSTIDFRLDTGKSADLARGDANRAPGAGEGTCPTYAPIGVE